MRIRTLSVVFLFAVAVCFARADVIFSGSVSGFTTTGSPCSAGGSASGSLSIGCTTGDSLGTGIVRGSGGAYGGELYVSSQEYAINDDPSEMVWVHANGELDLNETYVLVGGLGAATVNFKLTTSSISNPYTGPGDIACAFVFDGVSRGCGLGAGPFAPSIISEQVEYWVPFSIALNLQMDTVAVNVGDPEQFGDFTYSFGQPGLIALPPLPTPEPSSALLLLPGLAGVLFVARLRARRLVGRS